MREGMGLYRGKRVDNGEWVYGFLITMQHNDSRNHIHVFIMPLGTDMKYGTLLENVLVEVIYETVGQYTGRKDKNGNKIFEGDLLKHEDSKRYHQLFQIGFCETAAMFCFGKEHQSGFDFTYEEAQEFCLDNLLLNELVVCGNIYYNPELMG